jgi:hypothetical protein
MYLESDNRILLSGVYNQLTSAYVNNATVTLKIYSALAQEVGDQIGTDISLAYVAASNGNYAGYIGHAVIASAGYPLILKIIVVVGDYQLVVKVAVDGAYANLGNT